MATAAAIAALKAALGADAVLTGEAALEAYRDPYSFNWGEAAELRASGAVLPASVEQVQAVVRIARQHRLALHPVSGSNLTYGGMAPNLSGAVVVDLQRMKRILAVDAGRNIALVEPGVSYFDLYKHIKDKGLKVWLDVPDDANASVVMNALDRGVGYTTSAFRDHFGANCGMEVVTPTGEVVRTGMGALPGSDSWQDFPYAPGPCVAGLMGQGAFGIVTKMGFRLMPEPESTMVGIVSTPDYLDLGPMIEQVNYLEDAGVVNGKPFYNSPPFHVFEGTFPSAPPKADIDALMANGWPTLDQIKFYARRHGGPAWRITLPFYGPEITVRAAWDYVQERIAKVLPRASFQSADPVAIPPTPDTARGRKLAEFGIPSNELFEMTPAQVEAAEINAPTQGYGDFLAVVPRTAEAVFKAQRIIWETQKAAGIAPVATPFNAPIAWVHRSFLMAAPTVAVFKGDPARNAKARALYAAYVKNMAAAGFGAYRAPPAMQDLLASQYAFNDNALLRFHERLKDAADPDGIIAPGRYGLWPKRMRKGL
jgi:4-cresol dehydrogenase (hydroxylating)